MCCLCLGLESSKWKQTRESRMLTSLMSSFAEKPPLRKKDCRPTHGWRRGPTLAHAHTHSGRAEGRRFDLHEFITRLRYVSTKLFPSFSTSCFGSAAANCGREKWCLYLSWLLSAVLGETSGSGHLQLEVVFDCWVYAEFWPWCWWAMWAAAFHPEVGLPHSWGLLLRRHLLTAGDQRWVWLGRSEALRELLPADVCSHWGQRENQSHHRIVCCFLLRTCCVCVDLCVFHDDNNNVVEFFHHLWQLNSFISSPKISVSWSFFYFSVICLMAMTWMMNNIMLLTW